jgi:hypothetical protein
MEFNLSMDPAKRWIQATRTFSELPSRVLLRVRDEEKANIFPLSGKYYSTQFKVKWKVFSSRRGRKLPNRREIHGKFL